MFTIFYCKDERQYRLVERAIRSHISTLEDFVSSKMSKEKKTPFDSKLINDTLIEIAALQEFVKDLRIRHDM